MEEDEKDEVTEEESEDISEIEKDEGVEDDGDKEEELSTDDLVEKQNKQLKNIFIAIGIFIGVLAVGYFVVDSMKHFEYRGLTGEVVNEIAPYKLSIPVHYKGDIVPYNFYLRNDPRNLDKIPFEGEIVLKDNMVIGGEDFNCDGDGIIGVANLLKLYEIAGTQVITDENATCDSEGKYMFVNIQKGDETGIEQVGPACYNINVNNCDILKATERFMVETFVEIQKII
ncbi:MAG: hypothetical protein ABIA78_03760 [archaeon]